MTLTVIDTTTGRPEPTAVIKGKVIHWPDGIRQHNARPGLVHGNLRVVERVDGEPTGEGSDVRATGAHWDGADAWIIDREYYDPPSPPATVQDVALEAERRIRERGFALSVATVSPGTVFRCDTDSIARITGLANAPADLFPQTFVTRGGVAVTCPGIADAVAIKDEATRYVGRVLSTSAALQASPPATLAELKDDADWPIDGAA